MSAIQNFKPFPTLTTERLILRQVTKEDAQDVFKMRSDERTMRWIPRPLAKTEDDALAVIDLVNSRIDTGDGINWAICLKEDNRFIGMIGFVRMQPENFRAEVGYQLMFDHHRKGITLEALQAVIGYGFNGMHLHSIEAVIRPDNIASRMLIEKASFVLEGHFKENFFYHGQFQDSVVYSRLAPYAENRE